MIATIICGCLIILSCVLIFLTVKYDAEDILGVILIFLLVSNSIVLMGSLLSGYSFEPNLQEKHAIETLLEVDPNLYNIEKAKEYNKDVQFGNNLWCRFTIEDRSDYLIDIDIYL